MNIEPNNTSNESEHTIDEILDLIIKELDLENMDRTENLSEYKRTEN